MASKLLKFVYQECCVDRLRFQNICRLNRRPRLSLLDVKEKYTRHAGVSTNEAAFMWFVRSPRSSSEAMQDGMLPHIFAVLGVVCGLDIKAKIWIKIWVGMWLPYQLSHLVSSRGARNDTSKIENNKTQHSLKTQQTTIKFKQPSLQDARHPIHRVRIPYSKFSSPKTCRSVHENSLKIAGHSRF